MKTLRRIWLLIALMVFLVSCSLVAHALRIVPHVVVEYGGSANLTVDDSYIDDGFSYQWYERAIGSDEEWTLIEGADKATLSINNCIKNVEVHCEIITTDGRTLNGYWDIYILSAKCKGNENITVQRGQDVHMEVAASCSEGNLFYEWIDMDGETISDARNAVYIANYVRQAGDYTCIVYDDFGNEISCTWHIDIFDNPFTVKRKGNSRINTQLDGDVQMEVIASCDHGALRYEWADMAGNVIEGATDAVYVAHNVNKNGYYSCTVYDDLGNHTSLYWDIRIDNQLTVKQIGDRSVNVRPGEAVQMEVSASCKQGGLRYVWEDRYGNVIADATGASLIAENITKEMWYTCTVYDDYGNSSSRTWYIDVNNLVVNPVGSTDLFILPGADVRMEVTASCDLGELRYQWKDMDRNDIADATVPVFTAHGVNKTGRYSCVVTDDYGNTSYIYFEIKIDSGLGVDSESYSLTVPYGESAVLSTSAYCDSKSLSYEWEDFDYNTIDGAHGASYTTPPVEKNGTYRCYIKDEYGNTAEVRFDIIVANELTVFADGPQLFNLEPGESALLKVKAETKLGLIHYGWDSWDRSDASEKNTYNTGALYESGWHYCRIYDDYGNRKTVDFFCAVNMQTLTENVDVVADKANGDFCYFLITPETTGRYSISISGGWYDDFDLKRISNPEFEDIDSVMTLKNEEDRIYVKSAMLEAGKQYILEINLFEDNKTYTLRLENADDKPIQKQREITEREMGTTWYLRKGQTAVIPATPQWIDFYDPEITDIKIENEALLSANGDRITALAEGTTKVNVIYDDRDTALIYQVVVLDAPVVTLPSALNVLSAEAFAGDTDISLIELGNNVGRIERDAFNASGIRQLWVSSPNTTFAGGALRGIDGITLVVPKGSRAERYAREHKINYLLLP